MSAFTSLIWWSIPYFGRRVCCALYYKDNICACHKSHNSLCHILIWLLSIEFSRFFLEFFLHHSNPYCLNGLLYHQMLNCIGHMESVLYIIKQYITLNLIQSSSIMILMFLIYSTLTTHRKFIGRELYNACNAGENRKMWNNEINRITNWSKIIL